MKFGLQHATAEQAHEPRTPLKARVDPAHGEPVASLDPAGAEQTTEPGLRNEPKGAQQVPLLWEQLERHAGELAEQLRRSQADLDRRERRLHEQLAALELEQRRFRLWMQQVELEFHARQESLESRERALKRDPFVAP